MAIGDWTEERVRILKRHWKTNKSAREIAEMIGLSRNAVIGKAQRLGLSTPAPAKHAAVSRAKIERLRTRDPAPGGRPAIGLAPTPRLVLVGPATMADLTDSMCRYPFGDRPARMTFCAAPVRDGSSYCPTHHAACWDDPATRAQPRNPARHAAG